MEEKWFCPRCMAFRLFAWILGTTYHCKWCGKSVEIPGKK